MKLEIINIAQKALTELKINITQNQLELISDYFILLKEKNKSVNLISSKQDLETQVIIHLVDSLSFLLLSDFSNFQKVLDFGSGGGLPAIPLSIAQPKWEYTLVEAKTKKFNFLNEIKNSLKLNNVTIVNDFLVLGKNKENIYYDLITARAVANMKTLVNIAGPRLKNGGFLVAFKGPQGENEILEAKEDLKKYKFTLDSKKEFLLPFVNANRILYLFKKS